jgi:surface antigen
VRITDAPPYHGSGEPRRAAGPAIIGFACLIGLLAAGCSMSMELGSLFGKGDDAKAAEKGDDRDVTGSLQLQPSHEARADNGMTSGDWSLATAALREALGNREEGASVPWQNPITGARGTVTPVASAYLQEGSACRNFLASHVGKGREGWFEGKACRGHAGQWDVRSTRPLNKP